jgi:hypothetical protein
VILPDVAPRSEASSHEAHVEIGYTLKQVAVLAALFWLPEGDRLANVLAGCGAHPR